MARKKGIKFSFLWGVSLVVASGIIGGVYFKEVVDKIRFRYAQESYHRPTTTMELAKTKLPDRFVSKTPVFKVSSK